MKFSAFIAAKKVLTDPEEISIYLESQFIEPNPDNLPREVHVYDNSFFIEKSNGRSNSFKLFTSGDNPHLGYLPDMEKRLYEWAVLGAEEITTLSQIVEFFDYLITVQRIPFTPGVEFGDFLDEDSLPEIRSLYCSVLAKCTLFADKIGHDVNQIGVDAVADFAAVLKGAQEMIDLYNNAETKEDTDAAHDRAQAFCEAHGITMSLDEFIAEGTFGIL